MDFDGDGDLDLLSGSYTGEVYLFARDGDGSFQQGVFLDDHDGGPLRTGTSITPEVHDLDGDGDLDLLIGTRSSGVFVHENLGTRTEPSYAAEGTRLKTREGSSVMGSNAHYADWNHDGVRDLVLGSERGDVVWHENLGADDAPEFAEARKLIDIQQYGFEKVQRDVGPTHPGSRTKVHVTDWNGDGRVDLLVGDVRWLYYSEAPLTEAEEAELAELEPRFEKAMKAYLAAGAEWSRLKRSGDPIPEEVEARYEELKAAFESLNQKMRTYDREKTETHGFVWLYLRGGDPAGSGAPGTVRSDRAEGGAASLTAEASPGREEDTFEVELRLRIDAGWHTYAEAPEGAYPVTRPSLDLPDGFEQVGGFTAEGARLPADDDSGATWFLGEVTFTTTVRRAAGAKGRVEARVSYQACDDTVCLPPNELSVALEL